MGQCYQTTGWLLQALAGNLLADVVPQATRLVFPVERGGRNRVSAVSSRRQCTATIYDIAIMSDMSDRRRFLDRAFTPLLRIKLLSTASRRGLQSIHAVA